jgi:hypothetical protein
MYDSEWFNQQDRIGKQLPQLEVLDTPQQANMTSFWSFGCTG